MHTFLFTEGIFVNVVSDRPFKVILTEIKNNIYLETIATIALKTCSVNLSVVA